MRKIRYNSLSLSILLILAMFSASCSSSFFQCKIYEDKIVVDKEMDMYDSTMTSIDGIPKSAVSQEDNIAVVPQSITTKLGTGALEEYALKWIHKNGISNHTIMISSFDLIPNSAKEEVIFISQNGSDYYLTLLYYNTTLEDFFFFEDILPSKPSSFELGDLDDDSSASELVIAYENGSIQAITIPSDWIEGGEIIYSPLRTVYDQNDAITSSPLVKFISTDGTQPKLVITANNSFVSIYDPVNFYYYDDPTGSQSFTLNTSLQSPMGMKYSGFVASVPSILQCDDIDSDLLEEIVVIDNGTRMTIIEWSGTSYISNFQVDFRNPNPSLLAEASWKSMLRADEVVDVEFANVDEDLGDKLDIIVLSKNSTFFALNYLGDVFPFYDLIHNTTLHEGEYTDVTVGNLNNDGLFNQEGFPNRLEIICSTSDGSIEIFVDNDQEPGINLLEDWNRNIGFNITEMIVIDFDDDSGKNELIICTLNGSVRILEHIFSIRSQFTDPIGAFLSPVNVTITAYEPVYSVNLEAEIIQAGLELSGEENLSFGDIGITGALNPQSKETSYLVKAIETRGDFSANLTIFYEYEPYDCPYVLAPPTNRLRNSTGTTLTFGSDLDPPVISGIFTSAIYNPSYDARNDWERIIPDDEINVTILISDSRNLNLPLAALYDPLSFPEGNVSLSARFNGQSWQNILLDLKNYPSFAAAQVIFTTSIGPYGSEGILEFGILVSDILGNSMSHNWSIQIESIPIPSISVSPTNLSTVSGIVNLSCSIEDSYFAAIGITLAENIFWTEKSLNSFELTLDTSAFQNGINELQFVIEFSDGSEISLIYTLDIYNILPTISVNFQNGTAITEQLFIEINVTSPQFDIIDVSIMSEGIISSTTYNDQTGLWEVVFDAMILPNGMTTLEIIVKYGFDQSISYQYSVIIDNPIPTDETTTTNESSTMPTSQPTTAGATPGFAVGTVTFFGFLILLLRRKHHFP